MVCVLDRPAREMAAQGNRIYLHDQALRRLVGQMVTVGRASEVARQAPDGRGFRPRSKTTAECEAYAASDAKKRAK